MTRFIEYFYAPHEMRDDGVPFQRTVVSWKGKICTAEDRPSNSVFTEWKAKLSESRMMLPIIE